MTGTVFIVLSFILLAAGLVGAVVPALPGPPLSYAGLLLLHFSGQGTFTPAFLWIWAAVTAAVVVADNFLPAWMTKRFGGSAYAVKGSVVGLVAGMFLLPPVGLVLGPFLGAFAGELIYSRKQEKQAARAAIEPETRDSERRAAYAKALKVAFGSFLAFIAGTGAKLIVSSLMIFYAVKAVF